MSVAVLQNKRNLGECDCGGVVGDHGEASEELHCSALVYAHRGAVPGVGGERAQGDRHNREQVPACNGVGTNSALLEACAEGGGEIEPGDVHEPNVHDAHGAIVHPLPVVTVTLKGAGGRPCISR